MRYLGRKNGLFVTLSKYHSKHLRGCIGHTEGIMPLGKAIVEVASSSAFRDYRFHPVKKSELDNIIIDISILSRPELLTGDHKDYPENIEIGKHGLIIRKGHLKGVLLPPVAVERRGIPENFFPVYA